MTLRTRILLGYGYLIGLLLLSVSVAAINSQRVAGNAKQVLERSIRSLTHAIDMLEQLERQDSETLLALLNPLTGTRLEEAERAFEGALIAADDISKTDIDGEDRTTLASVRKNFDDYRTARTDLLSRVYDDPLTAAEDYRGATYKALLLLKAELTAYVDRKTESLKQANDEASRSAVEGAVLLGVMVTIALLSLGFLSRSLQRDVLGRLTEVGHVTEAIAAGDRRRRVRDFYQDELGLVARQLNAALDRQQELESQMQGRLLEQRRVLVGLMNQWPTPAGMIGIDGELVATTLTPEDEAELHSLTPRVRMAAKVLMTRRFVKAEELAVDIKAADGRRLVKIRALASGDNQIAGWLASFVDPANPEPASGVYPIVHEPSGVSPISHEPSGTLSVAELSGVMPMLRTNSGAASAARSGPLRAASREGSGARTAASEATGAAPPSTAPQTVAPPPSAAPPTVAPPLAGPPNTAQPNAAPPNAAPPTAMPVPTLGAPSIAPPGVAPTMPAAPTFAAPVSLSAPMIAARVPRPAPPIAAPAPTTAAPAPTIAAPAPTIAAPARPASEPPIAAPASPRPASGPSVAAPAPASAPSPVALPFVAPSLLPSVAPVAASDAPEDAPVSPANEVTLAPPPAIAPTADDDAPARDPE